ncbi:MAG TPA: FtsX-like permease family protein [Jatrophihabitans sp.]|nr:FtsX-like permease family protein [Jatrophihabitans sp.]
MIWLGVRLTLSGGREAITRLALIAIAVAVGGGLLLTALAGLHAVQSQNARYAWLETGFPGSNAPAGDTSHGTKPASDSLWWRLHADYFQGATIGRVDLAATGPDSPVPPGIAKLPGPGQFYASPALAKLLRETPRDQLGDRYPGTQVGTIGDAALPAPNSLIIVIGRSVADLAHQDGADLVNRISTTVPSDCGDGCAYGVGTNARGITLILSVVAAAVLFPVLIFIGGATRLSAARREQRFAAMRLVGATSRQISVISTVESAIAAGLGVAAGFGLFYAVRPALAAIPFTGDPFFTSDLSLSLAQILLVALGIPAAAAVVARIALRRVNISPLGVSRRVTPRPPRAWRLIVLAAGIAELGYFAYVHDIGAHTGTNPTTEAVLFLAGVLLVMGGLVIAGPWLTMIASRLVARRARRPATLIAARRLGDNPQAAFRAVSGLVLALFVGTCAIAIITTLSAYNNGTVSGSASSRGTLVDTFWGPPDTTKAIAAPPRTELTSIPGVTAVAVIHTEPASGFAPPTELVSCAELARIPALGHCAPGATTVTIMTEYGGIGINHKTMADTTWPPATVSTAQLQTMPFDSIVVGTDGTAAAVERARTVLDLRYSKTFGPETISEMQADNLKLIDSYRQLANVVILTSLPIAGCALAVSVAGGLIERKRPFSLLRLTGAPLALLRRVVGLEAAAPLLITAAVSMGAGLLAAQLFLRAQLQETLVAPGPQFYLVVAAGLLASLAIIASTLPLLNRTTGPEIARND